MRSLCGMRSWEVLHVACPGWDFLRVSRRELHRLAPHHGTNCYRFTQKQKAKEPPAGRLFRLRFKPTRQARR